MLRSRMSLIIRNTFCIDAIDDSSFWGAAVICTVRHTNPSPRRSRHPFANPSRRSALPKRAERGFEFGVSSAR
jgi:hypothetical protein